MKLKKEAFEKMYIQDSQVPYHCFKCIPLEKNSKPLRNKKNISRPQIMKLFPKVSQWLISVQGYLKHHVFKTNCFKKNDWTNQCMGSVLRNGPLFLNWLQSQAKQETECWYNQKFIATETKFLKSDQQKTFTRRAESWLNFWYWRMICSTIRNSQKLKNDLWKAAYTICRRFLEFCRTQNFCLRH